MDNIIGLSRTACSCQDLNSDTDITLSGDYLDESEWVNLNMAEAATDCNQGSLWTLMATARENATADFIADIQAELGRNNTRAVRNFSGFIGKKSYETTTTDTSSYTYWGTKWYPKPLKDGIWNIVKIGLNLNTTETVNVKIFSNLSTTALYSFNISCVANVLTYSATLNYALPMYNEGEVQYFFVATGTTGIPRVNHIACCGFNPTCNGWGQESQPDRMWYNYIMGGGIMEDTHQQMIDATPDANRANGFVIESAITCDSKQAICDNLDFTGSETAHLIALTVRHRASYYLLSYMLNSANINRGNMMRRDEMAEARSGAAQAYTDRIKYLGENMDISQNGCYECNPRLFIGSVRA